MTDVCLIVVSCLSLPANVLTRQMHVCRREYLYNFWCRGFKASYQDETDDCTCQWGFMPVSCRTAMSSIKCTGEVHALWNLNHAIKARSTPSHFCLPGSMSVASRCWGCQNGKYWSLRLIDRSYRIFFGHDWPSNYVSHAENKQRA